jgi:hypothetical protein
LKHLSAGERAAVLALGAVQLGLRAAALADLRWRPADQVNGRRPVWAALFFVNVIGPLADFSVGRRR